MLTYNFSANGFDFGNIEAESEVQAKDAFAIMAGYLSWQNMCDRADEFGGNTVECTIVYCQQEFLI